MQNTETKGVGEKLDDETSGTAGFSGIKKRAYSHSEMNPRFFILSCLIFQSCVERAGISQFRCRTFWAPNFPFTFGKSPVQ
jgi:hypothetical protein